ncbi:MAG: 3-hydroxyacyl-CoA dehydrogenase NAD-binding domain-containing protein, partial [Rhodospirillales bacterium]|nr:3-hydroxyacyl-CoA dehydrogenase NAD-binding domain-containing protein [Rhodospirillales bacterium]
MAQRITIIGDGAMATVMALLLESKGLHVTVWGIFPDNVAQMIQTRENRRYLPGYQIPDRIQLTSDVGRAVAEADLLLNAVPTQYIRDVWQRLAKHVPAGIGIGSVAKGIERDTTLLPTQIVADVLGEAGDGGGGPARPYVAISGPTVASELARNLPATVVAASGNQIFARQMQQIFT